MEDVRWPAEQLEEHRLEISNRIRNLFWTVSGDYDMEFEPDTEKYVYSKQTVLYEAVKQGAFARYFDQKKLGMYLMKIIYVFLTIFLYLLKCPQSLILSALRAFCLCGKPHISRLIFLYFPCQSWLKSW